MKRLYIHGTSFESGESILKNGFGNPEDKKTTTTWNVSDCDSLYLRCLSNFDIYGKNNYDTIDLDREEPIENFYKKILEDTLYNATITSAFQNSQSEKTYLFFFLLDDEDDEILEDASCPNMENCWEIPHEIANKKCIGNLLVDCYIPLFRVFYFPSQNQTFNEDELEITEHEKMLSLACEDTFTIFEELHETRCASITPAVITKILEFSKLETD